MKKFRVGVLFILAVLVLPNFYGGMAATGDQVQGGGGCWGGSRDGTPEASEDFDADDDGVLDASDNCPNEFNPSQTDIEGVIGVGDLCETLGPKTCEDVLVCENRGDCEGHEGLIASFCGEGFLAEGQVMECCDQRCTPIDPEATEENVCPVGTCSDTLGGHCTIPEDCPFDSDCQNGCCVGASGGSCGDGAWSPPEEACDYVVEGDFLAPRGCSEGICNPNTCLCETEGGPVCGNLQVDFDEPCDFVMTPDGPQPEGECNFAAGETCNENTCTCQGAAVCGNETVDAGEDCDYIIGRSGPEASGSCDFAGGETCNENTCTCQGAAVCGNETVDVGEDCDYIIGRSGPEASGSCDFAGGETCDANSCECLGVSQDFCDELQCPGICDSVGDVTFCNDIQCGDIGANCQSDSSVCEAIGFAIELPLFCNGSCCEPIE